MIEQPKLAQRILWYPHVGHNAPHVGIVTKVCNETINVTLLSEGTRMVMPKDGVHHVSDPRARKPELVDNGCWDWTEEDKAMAGLWLRVAALAHEVETLKAKLHDLEGAVTA